MTYLTLWVLTIALFACAYAALTLTLAFDLPWQTKSVIWSNVGLIELILVSATIFRR